MPIKPKVTIYTDGACKPNPGKGGWAALLRTDGQDKVLTGNDRRTTSNRMELIAALKAIQSLREPCKIDFYTDSQYLRRGITEWMPGWIKRNWQRQGGKLANVDLWKALNKTIQKHEINWIWVRGHSTNKFNQRVDRLAVDARKALK